MDKFHETVHYEVYDVHKPCKMAEFGRSHIPGFRPESGCGFFEFKKEEFLKLHKAVILIDKVLSMDILTYWSKIIVICKFLVEKASVHRSWSSLLLYKRLYICSNPE